MAIDFSMPVLVVDDMNTMGRIIGGLLRQLGFQNVDIVPGGFTALTRMRTARYCLVLSDWHMQPVTGLDLLNYIRSDPNLADTRFIMMTAEATADHVLAAKNAGADGYIAKPFTAQSLKAKIDMIFRSARTADGDRIFID
jgi:two-component system chemotaxis response regulator CheY